MKEKMKDSGIPWIGQIPEDWEVCKVKNFFIYKKRIVGDDAENWQRLALTLNGVIKRSKDDSEGLQPEKFEGYQILMQNELVFKLIDLNNIQTSRVGLSNYDGIVSPAYIILSPQNISVLFSYYYFISLYYRNIFNTLGDDGVRSSLNSLDLLNLKIVVPPQEIQQKIVEILDKKCGQIDELVSLEENEIEKLKEYKTSLITKVVTKGLDPNAKMKDSGTWQLDRIPTNWQLKKLLYYLEMPITDGPHETPTLRDDGIPFISAESIKNNSIDFSKMRGYISNEYNSIISKKYSPKTNDIFIIKSGATTGNVAYVKDFVNFNIWSPLAVIRVNKYNYWKFIFYVLQSIYFQQQIQLSWSFGTQQNLSMRVLETLKIASPDIKVQHQIVECLDKKCEEIDNLIKIKQEKIEKMKEYKKSLIYQYVTGKKEV